MQYHCIKMRYSTEPRDPSKRVVQKTEEATGDLIGNKIADKITSVSTELHSKKSSEELLSKNRDDNNNETEVPKKMHISRRKTTNYR